MKKLVVIALLTLQGIASGQGKPVESKPYIQVTGSAESDINPNIIVLSVRLKEFEENKEKSFLIKLKRIFWTL